MENIQRKFIGWIDKIIIYHYFSGILFKFSEMETWIFSPLCQDVFSGGDVSSQDEFNKGLSRATWGSKISYLRGEDLRNVTHTKESLQRLSILKQHEEFSGLFSKLEKALEKRNPFVHADYFMGYGNEDDTRLTFKSSYLKQNGECENVELTPKTIKEKYLMLDEEYEKMRRLYLRLVTKVYK